MDKGNTQRHFNFPSLRLIGIDSERRRVKRTALLLAAAPIFVGSIALGQDSWTRATGGSWTDTTKWSTGALPTNEADFNLGSTTGYTIAVPAGQGAPTLNVDTDNVTLSLGGHFAGAFSEANIGSASGQNGSLTLSG